MSYREYEAIVLSVCPRYGYKDIERFQKVANEKHFRFNYLEDYNLFVYTPSVKILREGYGWGFFAKVKAEKGSSWCPSFHQLEREVTDIEKIPINRDLKDAPEIYGKPSWVRVELLTR